MYFEHIQQFRLALGNLLVLLHKAEQFVDANSASEESLLQSRLAPDMFPLIKQIQSTCDSAKLAAARLSGQSAPVHEDTETSLIELKARVHRVLDFLGGFREGHFSEASARHIVLPFVPDMYLSANDYLVQFALPNFYFHLTTAYALLRQQGLSIGKQDFIGQINFKALTALN